MINRTILVCRLTKAPDLRDTPNGAAVATFTLAGNRIIYKPGTKRSRLHFSDCLAKIS